MMVVDRKNLLLMKQTVLEIKSDTLNKDLLNYKIFEYFIVDNIIYPFYALTLFIE